MSVLSQVQFWMKLIPVMQELASQLYKQFAGNHEAAIKHVRHIIDHGVRFDEAQSTMEARISAAEAKYTGLEERVDQAVGDAEQPTNPGRPVKKPLSS